MRKKRLLQALNEVYCRLAATSHGVGVVAIRPIPKGTDPFKNCDPHGDVVKIPVAELDAYDAPKEAKELLRDFCVMQDGYYYVPDYGVDAIDKSYFLNHSKSPNIETKDGGESFAAMRNIKKGEELTADYDTYQEFRRGF